MDKPFVHFIKLYKDIYLFDVNTNMICKVNERILEYFTGNRGREALSVDDVFIIENMRKCGMLQPNKIEKLEHPMTEIVEDILENNMTKLTMQVTQNCNFRCDYCVYSGSYHNRVHNNKRMDWKTAKAALDFLCNHSKSSAEINISFYGGEPLLEMELIKKCVDYARKIFKRKRLAFNLTTNASLLTEDIILYMNKENFQLTISLDGPQEVHDKNRTFSDGKHGTYAIAIEKIKKINEIAHELLEHVTFNAVLDDENDFALINQYFTNEPIIKDMIVSTNYINDVNRKDKIERGNARNYVEICNEKFVGMMYLLDRVSRESVSKLVVREVADIREIVYKRNVSEQVMQKEAHPGGPCMPGVQRPFVNAYGKLFPCERVNETCEEMCIGNIYDGFDIDKVKKLLNVGKITEEVCKNCWAFNFCTQCAVTADNGERMTPAVRLEKCNKVRSHVENLFKDFIVLKECGCDFSKVF